MRHLLLFAASLLVADDRNIDFDKATDFEKFRTYSLRRGVINARGPDLDSPIVNCRVDAAIRAQFAAKAMEEGSPPDLVVTWHLGAANKREVQSWPRGRYGMGTGHSRYNYTQGTLVIDMTDAATNQLVWRGIYRDDESSPAKVA